MADLRKDKRAPASLKVKYKSATVEEFIEQFGIDVSSGGIFVKTKKPIETGALLKLELQLNDASPVIHGVGRVCWRREPGPDATLPAGMGIKFIKLDPGSRTIVDRIVQARGPRRSRFDQSEGAEIAAPSIAPDADTPPPAPLPPPLAPQAAPKVVKPAPASASGKHEPVAAPRAQSPGASAVAGLFADSPLSRESSPEQSPAGGRRSSFFPPPAEAQGSGSGQLPSAPRVPPPAAFGASPKASGLRAERTRQSGEFLAAALAAGGVAEPASAPPEKPPEPSQPAEDELIDQLFADVMSSGRLSNAPGAAPAAADRGSVDDVFAALSEEEGLGSGAAARPAPPVRPSQRPTAPRVGDEPARKSEPDNVDELFADLNQAKPLPAAAQRGAKPAVKPAAPAVDSFDAEWDGPTNDLEETDLAAASLAPSALPQAVSEPPAAPPTLGLADGAAPAAARAARPSSTLMWIIPLLIAVGVGGYFYYQQQLAQLRASEGPRAVERGVPRAPAADRGQRAAGAVAPAGAAEQAAPAGAGAKEDAPRAARERAAGAVAEGTPERVEIEITSLPRGASVQVDGKTIGVSPLHAELPTGKQAEVTVSSEGYATMTKQIVPAAENDPLRFKLEPLPYELSVRTDPPDAELSVGAVTAIAPGPLALGHLDGSVQVSVGKVGYQRMTRPVRIEEFREESGVMRAEIEVRLSPLPGGAIEQALQPPARQRLLRRRPAAPAPPAPPEPPAGLAPAPSAPPPSIPPPVLRPEAVAPVRPE
jgi:uncharacterized protein (TIGR02266 family)